MNNIKLKNKFVGNKVMCDIETGEIVSVPQFVLHRVNAGFIQTYITPRGLYMLKPKEFTATDHQMLDYFCLLMDKQNKVYSTVPEIMERLGLSQPTVYRSITELRRYDFIKRKGNSYYMVNPNAYCKVEAKLRIPLIEEYDGYEKFNEDKN